MKRKLELLCPARDLEGGKLAINYGADAVYIGAQKFGARSAAGNSIDDIEKLCEYAHLYYAKVYVTINTILYDNELEDVKALIFDLYSIGVDAIIIQDMAILEMDLPPIPLHASTQTHNYELDRIQFIDKIGFNRIILARELSIQKIKEIKSITSSELEFFIHGALCVSLSGQCNASHSIVGRSANRGECAQICRMPFNLLDADKQIISKNKHFLSLKDFNASSHLSELIHAGITSFKIEGRLKDNNYIINNTSYYRQLIDQFISENNNYGKLSSGKTEISFLPDPERSFNRGFTDYFLAQRKQGLTSFDSPKSKGKYLGKVVTIGSNFMVLNTELQINNGDGLCFINLENSLVGFHVNKVENNKIYPDEMPILKVGTEIFRNSDRLFIKELENNKDIRKISIKIKIAETDNGFRVEAIDEDANKVSELVECEKIPATNALKANETIIKQLSKGGDSVFKITHVQIEFKKDYFISIGELNQIRRNLLEKLQNERIKNYKQEVSERKTTETKYPTSNLDFKSNISNKLSKLFYEKHGVIKSDLAFELHPKSFYAEKVVMTTRYCLKFELGICPHKQEKTEKNNMYKEPLYLADRNRKYRLEFDCKECLMKVVNC